MSVRSPSNAPNRSTIAYSRPKSCTVQSNTAPPQDTMSRGTVRRLEMGVDRPAIVVPVEDAGGGMIGGHRHGLPGRHEDVLGHHGDVLVLGDEHVVGRKVSPDVKVQDRIARAGIHFCIVGGTPVYTHVIFFEKNIMYDESNGNCA